MTAEQKESIEVCGVRFSADEVKAVTLERDGRKITIDVKPEQQGAVIGFAKAEK